MDEQDWLAERFEQDRPRLRAVAYRMLGSQAEAEDAVQEAWLRLSRAGAGEVDNLSGWLTTVVGRICLNLLRSRRTHREEPLPLLPDLVLEPDPADGGPEHEAVLADTVGLAMLVVLDTLSPAERLAFVLHDMFDLPFEEIAGIAGRTPAAARQLASRARRRVRGAPVPDADTSRQRAVVNAFFAAARGGDFGGLVAVLDPDVVVRSDGGAARPAVTQVTVGAEAVARQALTYAQPKASLIPVLVNGTTGVVALLAGRPFAVMAFTVRDGRILEVDTLADPDRLAALDLTALTG
jgi:RNA polymerase sigma-70 factor (ECF subfamily)